MFLKDLIGKKVLSYDGKILGYTRSAMFSIGFKRIAALLCSDENEDDFILPLSPKQNFSDALIMPRRPTSKINAKSYSPLLKQVYSLQGEFLGYVSAVELNGLSLKSIQVNQTYYPAEKIKAFGDCILVNTKKTEIRICKNTTKSNKKIPLGRTLHFNVSDNEGKVLFKKGAVIDKKIIHTALTHKKLLELTAKTIFI